MAVSNEIFISAVGILFVYLVVYRKYKFFGLIAFTGISLAIMSNSTNNLLSATGFVMMIASLIMAVLYIIEPTKPAHKLNS